MRGIALVALLVAFVFGAAACGGGGSSSGSGSGKTEVDMVNYYFQPAKVTGPAGKKITLELKNGSADEHNFTLTEQNVDQDVEPGEEAEVTVTIPKTGTLTFFCEYHHARGMTGQLQAGKSSGY